MSSIRPSNDSPGQESSNILIKKNTFLDKSFFKPMNKQIDYDKIFEGNPKKKEILNNYNELGRFLEVF